MPDFLVAQIIQRARFLKPKEETEEAPAEAQAIPTELFDGRFAPNIGGGAFEISILNFSPEKSDETLVKTLQVVRDVLGGYQYEDYNWVVVRDLLTARKLTLDRNTIESYWKKKITAEEILESYLQDDVGQAQVFKNALEVFGFTQPTTTEEPSETEAELIGDER